MIQFSTYKKIYIVDFFPRQRNWKSSMPKQSIQKSINFEVHFYFEFWYNFQVWSQIREKFKWFKFKIFSLKYFSAIIVGQKTFYTKT